MIVIKKSQFYGPKREVDYNGWLFPPQDYFGTVKSKTWQLSDVYYCREEFHRNTRRLSKMLFGSINPLGVATFMHIVEKKVACEPFSKFGPTSRDGVMWIEPSSWWWESAMRRSLFTALLRSAQAYRDGVEFEHALYSSWYLSFTRKAVQRFLAGYTKYVGRTGGWYNTFRTIGDEKLKQVLAKP